MAAEVQRVKRGNSIIEDASGNVTRMAAMMYKKRPGTFQSWKKRYIVLNGSELSWREDGEDGKLLGSCDVTGAKIQGEAMNSGGNDLDCPPRHLIFTIEPVNDKKMIILKATALSAARLWITALRKSSSGEGVAAPKTAAAAPAQAINRTASLSNDVRDVLEQAGLDHIAEKFADLAIETLDDLKGTDEELKEQGWTDADIAKLRVVVPAEAGEPASPLEPEEAAQPSPSSPSTQPEASSDGQSEWATATSPEGATYYYNTRTRESSWVPPPGWVPES